MDCGIRDQVALVTGASGGIGEAIAQALAAEGCSIAVHYHRNAAAAQRIAAELVARHGVRAIALGADLRDEEATERAFAQCLEGLGRLDHLIVSTLR